MARPTFGPDDTVQKYRIEKWAQSVGVLASPQLNSF